MIHFPILRTRRLTVQLQEISIGNAIAIAGMPEHLEQSECTAFLKAVTKNVSSGPQSPSDWTLQERTMAIAHYMASTLEDGPDFSLKSGKYSDYLDGAADISPAMTKTPIGEIGGDHWSFRHLTGGMLESIERLSGEIPEFSMRTHWQFGCMAAQLIRDNEELPEINSDGQFDEWLLKRMQVLKEFPETEFTTLLLGYEAGKEKLHHLFSYDFSDDGIVILPKGGLGGELPPARFRGRSCLSAIAFDLAGKHDRAGG